MVIELDQPSEVDQPSDDDAGARSVVPLVEEELPIVPSEKIEKAIGQTMA